jgi:hypothetical protein
MNKIVKVRWRKEYPDATNHVCIGEVKEEAINCLKIYGKTFHFKRSLSSGETPFSNIGVGKSKTRWIPWSAINLVTELPEDIDWENMKFGLDENGTIIVSDEGGHVVLLES